MPFVVFILSSMACFGNSSRSLQILENAIAWLSTQRIGRYAYDVVRDEVLGVELIFKQAKGVNCPVAAYGRKSGVGAWITFNDLSLVPSIQHDEYIYGPNWAFRIQYPNRT